MASKKIHKGGFPWRAGSFFLLLVVGAIVAYDTHKHGSFEATSTGKFMRDSGITASVQKTWVTTTLYFGKGIEYLEASSPEYYKATVVFCKPYVKLSQDVYLSTKNFSIKLYSNVANYVTTKTPVVIALIEQYAPGLLNNIQVNSIKALELIKTYSAFIAEQTIENSVKATRWLKTNVFVGKLSPESLQNYASQAINTTHTFASQTYDWVYEKVQTLSKVQ